MNLFNLKIFFLCLGLLPLIVVGQVDLNKGLVAYYPFNGNAKDASGNGNDAVFNNSISVAGKDGVAGTAYRFDGYQSYMRIKNSASLNPTSNNITLYCLVKPSGFYYGNCHWSRILNKGKGSDYDDDGLYWMGFCDDVWQTSQGSGACNQILPDTIHQTFHSGLDNAPWGSGIMTKEVVKDQWFSYIVTYDGVTVRYYIDCKLVDSVKNSNIIFNNTEDLIIGKLDNAVYPYWYKGDIDEIRIYNRALNSDEVAAISPCKPSNSCSNWLNVTKDISGLQIGDLDIPGNKVTVEAVFNRTQPYSGAQVYAGDLVSKHEGPSTVNYLLRPNSAEINVNGQYFKTPNVCDIELNKTYHVALVYNGSVLKFYRNGYLMSQISCSGNLYQNNYLTAIGTFASNPNQPNENLVGYINEVRIWNVARTQAQIKQYMNSSLPNPATQSGLLAYYTFDDLLNKQGNAQWNATILGNASINNTNTSCIFIADSCAKTTCSVNPDFTYSQDACNPRKIAFNNETTNTATVSWSFGNGTLSSSNNPAITYNAFGTYTVKMVVTDLNGCTDSISKDVQVKVVVDSIIITRDTIICKSTGIKLNTVAAQSYCWSPGTTLNDSTIANPIATPLNTTTYAVTAKSTGLNLVTNGNFSAGNSGFSSEYNYTLFNNTEGQYFVGPNPQSWNPAVQPCPDHTGSSGNMLMVNGNPVADKKIWCQTINGLKPNTNYTFIAWLQSVYAQNPAQLQFYINGNIIGNIFTADFNACNWKQFYQEWNSGNNTTANICIVNKNTIIDGNDFALDDISFSEQIIKQDTVKISISIPIVNAGIDTAICLGSTTQLNATGALAYKWNKSPYLSDTTIANPVASPPVTTQFIVKGFNAFGCIAIDTILVVVSPKPVFTLTNDTSICKGNSLMLTAAGNGIVSYNWNPDTTLSNTGIFNPVANPTDTTEYFITVTNSNGCAGYDSVTLNVVPLPVVATLADSAICDGSTVLLTTTGNANSYNWSPSIGLNNAGIKSPVASPGITTEFFVTAQTVEGCQSVDSVTITVNPAPQVTASSDTVICSKGQAQLNVMAPSAISFLWVPPDGLDSATILNPLATPASTTQYIITVKANNGCTNKDSVLVSIYPKPVFGISPQVSSICSGKSISLSASGGDEYFWVPDASLSTFSGPQTLATPVQNTVYTVNIRANTCNDSAALSATVNVKPGITVNAEKLNDIDCFNNTVNLLATGAEQYNWSPSTGLNDPNIPNPVATPLSTTVYTVTGTNMDGCKDEDTVTVKVDLDARSGYYMADAFTPNGDGKNDCIGPKYWGNIQSLEYVIYNRWGNEVFRAAGTNACWNGIYRGLEQPSGAYAYFIKANTDCGYVYKQGTITLIR